MGTPRVVMTMTIVLGVGAAAAACSGDSGESRLRTERWIENADEICEDENAALAEIEAPNVDPFVETLTDAELGAVATYLDRTLVVQAETTERFDDLGLPADDADEIEDVFEQREAGRIAVERAIEHARDGDAEQFVLTYTEAVTQYDKATRGAREFGLEECGQ